MLDTMIAEQRTGAAAQRTGGSNDATSTGRHDPRIHRGRAGIMVVLALLLLSGAVVALALRGMVPASPAAASTQIAQPPVLAVAVAPVESRPMARLAVGDGSVVAWQELAIDAEVGGLRVVEIAVDEGDAVRQGQVLLRFDDSVLAAQLAQFEAAVTEEAAAVEFARSDFGRATALSRGAFIAAQTVEQRQAAARQADARLMSARARRDEAAVRLAQARLLAPADGIVVRRSVQLGAVSAAGQEMFRLVRDGRLELDAKVPELDLAAVRPGLAAHVVHGDWQTEATVRAVAPMVAADTRLGLVHIALPPGSGLSPGMFARAEIRLDAVPALVVPQVAIVFREDTPAVFVLDKGNRVSLRRLATGVRRDGLVEILAGLRVGESVVTSGAGFLSDGDHVQVVPALAIAVR
jgi:RND family efflux transporter MFP subunit